MIETILILIACHLIGDYVLQCDYIATSKGTNWYHMFVHCFLYCVPFCIVFSIDYRIVLLFITHIFIDSLKARYKKINYVEDQVMHYLFALMIFLI
jgi:hypothetical protein